MRFPKVLVASALFAGVCIPALSQAASPSAPSVQKMIALPTVPDGTPVHMRVIRMVSSESDRPGEQVEFEVVEDVTLGDKVLVAQGASVWGKVTAAAPADHVTNQRGVLEIRVDGLPLPSGQVLPLRNLKELPMEADADVTPDKLANLINSPYGPFLRFTRLPEVTIPKNTPLTLYVAADVPLSNAPRAAAPARPEENESSAGSVADRIVGNSGKTQSLGDIAREARRKGTIGRGMTSSDHPAETLNSD